MQLGIAAPLVAMKAAGASDEEISIAAIALADIPPGAWQEIKQNASDRARAKGYTAGHNEAKLGRVAGTLWKHFADGVRQGGSQMPSSGAEKRKLLLAAYTMSSGRLDDQTGRMELSGDLIVDCLPLWDANDKEPTTDYCAYRCGIHAAKIAIRLQQPEVGHTMYQEAFETTRAEMSPIVDRARCLYGSSGPHIKGGGC
jgi:hypothetical protein